MPRNAPHARWFEAPTVDFASERAPARYPDDAMAERLIAAAMGRPLASTPPPARYSHRDASEAHGPLPRSSCSRHRSNRLVLVGSPRVHPASARQPCSGRTDIAGETVGRAAAPNPPHPSPVEAPIPGRGAPAPPVVREAPGVARPKAEAENPLPSADDILTAANEARRRGDSASWR